MHRCGVGLDHDLEARSEQGASICWQCAAQEEETILYLPGLNILFKICMKVLPAFDIRRVSTTHSKSFNCPGDLLRPELVQFCITSPNLS